MNYTSIHFSDYFASLNLICLVKKKWNKKKQKTQKHLMIIQKNKKPQGTKKRRKSS